MLICPWVGDVKVDGVRVVEAFKWGFLAAGTAMMLGTISFYFLKNRYIVAPSGEPVGLKPNFNAVVDKTTESEKAEFSNQSIGITLTIFAILVYVFHSFIATAEANPIKDWIYPIIYASGLSLAFLII
jgi:POT family proton-dependent oligopeptide transporter